MRMQSLSLGLLILLSGCTGVESTATTMSAKLKYDHLLAYVPNGMESILAFDLRDSRWPQSIQDVFKNSSTIGVFSGRKFRFPSRTGMGDFEGVAVFETSRSLREICDQADEESRFEQVEILSEPVPGVPGARTYHAKPTANILVITNRAKLMTAALKRTGTAGQALAAAMGWTGPVRWDGPMVLLRRPDPEIPFEEKSPGARPVLWLLGPGSDEVKERYRVTEVLVEAVDPARLQFEARVKFQGKLHPDQLAGRFELWETWGGIQLADARARLEGGELVLNGHVRDMIAREGPTIIYLLALGWLGVKIFI